MANGWLLYSEEDAVANKAYIEWFIDEADKQELTLRLILREKLQIGILQNEYGLLLDGRKTEIPEFAVVRTVEPLLNKQLEQLNVHVFNSSYVSEISNHKAKTYLEVSRLGIPMVDTVFLNGKNVTNEIPFPLPFVIKEAAGRGGRQVYFIQEKEEWDVFLTMCKPIDYVIQSTDVQLGKDLRVFVVDKEIVGAVLRESNTDFRANFTLGGSASLYQLNEVEKALIMKIIDHFDFGMVGIDFLIGRSGELLFNEIEDVVGSRTLSTVSNMNILEKYIIYIKQQLKQGS
ncbi:hypothetical protein KGF86_04365 [Ornithinibacillus massiliensis]|uniref:ATP-grasp domain-containing protein n=1 Tax=Ornithinibacillus massiliensis TaxID=1944633 RepID=A0ABS5MAW9_9BACI|nr:hypothetical protein [Ornithinibacillus massiliensis]